MPETFDENLLNERPLVEWFNLERLVNRHPNTQFLFGDLKLFLGYRRFLCLPAQTGCRVGAWRLGRTSNRRRRNILHFPQSPAACRGRTRYKWRLGR